MDNPTRKTSVALRIMASALDEARRRDGDYTAARSLHMLRLQEADAFGWTDEAQAAVKGAGQIEEDAKFAAAHAVQRLNDAIDAFRRA